MCGHMDASVVVCSYSAVAASKLASSSARREDFFGGRVIYTM
jgi:hypothetical protein